MAPTRAPPKPANDPAHAQELQQFGAKHVCRYVDGVRVREAERDAVLPQVVADGDLPAERVAPPCHVQLIEIVRVRLDEHGHLKLGQLQGISHAFFVAEIRKTDQDAFDAVPVLAEQVRARLRVLPGLDRAELRRPFVEHDAVDVERGAQGQEITARFADELVRKEIPIADDDWQAWRGPSSPPSIFRAKYAERVGVGGSRRARSQWTASRVARSNRT